MENIKKLATLVERIDNNSASEGLSEKVISTLLDLPTTDAAAWIEMFGDPLKSLGGAKALAEQLGLDWHLAMSAGAEDLEGRPGWCLPDLAPRAVAWGISQLIADVAAIKVPSSKLH